MTITRGINFFPGLTLVQTQKLQTGTIAKSLQIGKNERQKVYLRFSITKPIMLS